MAATSSQVQNACSRVALCASILLCACGDEENCADVGPGNGHLVTLSIPFERQVGVWPVGEPLQIPLTAEFWVDGECSDDFHGERCDFEVVVAEITLVEAHCEGVPCDVQLGPDPGTLEVTVHEPGEGLLVATATLGGCAQPLVDVWSFEAL